jgi:hypothetical protein
MTNLCWWLFKSDAARGVPDVLLTLSSESAAGEPHSDVVSFEVRIKEFWDENNCQK